MAKRPRTPKVKAPVSLPADVVHDLEESIRITVALVYYDRQRSMPNPFEEVNL